MSHFFLDIQYISIVQVGSGEAMFQDDDDTFEGIIHYFLKVSLVFD